MVESTMHFKFFIYCDEGQIQRQISNLDLKDLEFKISPSEF